MSNTSKRKQDYQQQSDSIYKAIGERIKELQKESGKTQAQFYDVLFPEKDYQETSDTAKTGFIHDMETGSKSELNLAALFHIAQTLNVSVEWLIYGKSVEPSSPSSDEMEPSGDDPEVSGDTTDAEKPIDKYMTLTPHDICNALVALSRICDIKAERENNGKLSQPLTLKITSKAMTNTARLQFSQKGDTAAGQEVRISDFLYSHSEKEAKGGTPIVTIDNRGVIVVNFLSHYLDMLKLWESNRTLIPLESFDKSIQDSMAPLSCLFAGIDLLNAPISSSIGYPYTPEDSIMHIVYGPDLSLKSEGPGYFHAQPHGGRYDLTAYDASLAAERPPEGLPDKTAPTF